MKKEKVTRKITIGLLLLILLVSLMLLGLFATVTSCDDDDHKCYEVTHKIVYKAEGSAGVNITSATYNEPGLFPGTSVTNLNGTTWKSPEITSKNCLSKGDVLPLTALAEVEATGPNATSTLKVQIYVDGVLKNEVTTTGLNLKTKVNYNVEYKLN